MKKADKTFECARKNGYRAANAGQFMVDLVVPMGSLRETQVITFSESDLVATEVPDPRAFHYRGQIPIVFGMDPRSGHKEMSWA